ncbi:MAG: biopolymer transporter ExbD [Planctomycetes bacterium]|nr:biopolymer transporter ExbD [Planctomycetota bacterium]
MRRIRREPPEARIELNPLIDLMTFLLTFFIYAVVMMVRVDMVPMELKRFSTGQPAKPAPAATISLDIEGLVYFNKEKITVEEVAARVKAAREADPTTIVYLAVDHGQGKIDRAPILQDLWDRLKDLGVAVNFVGKPSDGKPTS